MFGRRATPVSLIGKLLGTEKIPEQAERINQLTQRASAPVVNILVVFDARIGAPTASVMATDGQTVPLDLVARILEAAREGFTKRLAEQVNAKVGDQPPK